MTAILTGALIGAVIGLLYLVGRERAVQQTLIRSVLLGICVGILVELARRPLFSAIFAGVATIFLMEFMRWVMRSMKNRS